MSGSFFFECYDIDGNVRFSEDLKVGSGHYEVQKALIDACPWLRDSFTVYKGDLYDNKVDGLNYNFYFERIKGNLEQFKIHSSFTDALKGNNISYEFKTTQTYGPNVFYDVIPFEQIFTADVSPAIRVKVDGMPVLCKSTHCTYTYEALPSLITDFSVSGSTVTITGTDLPVEISKVVFSN